ncbi:flavodoxin domain-containing protein [Lactococcus allomyrinae]|nr:flavodoxin domain-containing protein [Lactococcus allomyrinae]
MKILIAYAGKTGVTERCAKQLAKECTTATLANLNEKQVSPENFDLIVVGSPVYSHKLEPSVKYFIKDNEKSLQEKQFAVFVTMVEEDTFDKVIAHEIPESLRQRAFAMQQFGGEVNDLTSFGWHDRLVAKAMVKLESKKHPIALRLEALLDFAKILKEKEVKK